MTSLIVQQTERSRILKTNQYSLFKCNEKLKINNSHLEKVIDWLSEKNLSKDLPILVDQNYNILDGRYRFLANTKLEAPIYYKIAEVGTLTDFLKTKLTSLRLGTKEWAIYYKDNINYRKLLDKCETFQQYHITTLVRIVTGWGQAYRVPIYINGQFIYTNDIEIKFEVTRKIINKFQDKFGNDFTLTADCFWSLSNSLCTLERVIKFFDDNESNIKFIISKMSDEGVSNRDISQNFVRLIIPYCQKMKYGYGDTEEDNINQVEDELNLCTYIPYKTNFETDLAFSKRVDQLRLR